MRFPSPKNERGSFGVKLSSLMLSTEEGRAYALKLAEEQHGAEIAADMIKAATYQEELAQQYIAAEESGALAAEEFFKNASTEEKDFIVKLAHVHARAKFGLRTELEKSAYDAGAAGAAGMADAGLMGEEMPPEATSEQIGDPDIMMVLDQLVQSGELSPETAALIAQAAGVGGAEGGVAPEAGGLPPGDAPPEGGGGEEMAGPPPEEDAPEAEKEAFAIVKSAASVIDAALS